MLVRPRFSPFAVACILGSNGTTRARRTQHGPLTFGVRGEFSWRRTSSWRNSWRCTRVLRFSTNTRTRHARSHPGTCRWPLILCTTRARAHTRTQIRMQQEKIWELQAQEENVRTELEELKGTSRTCVHVSSVPVMRSLHAYCARVLLCANLIDHCPPPRTVELKVKKRMLNSKSRLAEQLEVPHAHAHTLLTAYECISFYSRSLLLRAVFNFASLRPNCGTTSKRSKKRRRAGTTRRTKR
jgi:hypothetical protein